MDAPNANAAITPERWHRIEQLLDEAFEFPPGDRDAFLDEACSADPDLLREVKSLLDADADVPSFLDEDVAAFAIPALPETAFADEGLAGQVFGPYRLLRRIGAGGMSFVYLAERDDAQFKKQVAVKLLRYPGLDEAHGRQRFLAERQILASLSHPHIAQVFDGGVAPDGAPYLVMEYVDGLPLTEYCRSKRLSIKARLLLFEDVCAAVQEAHRHLIVHRDLKPSNIVVTDNGSGPQQAHVKLLDFGIAKLLGPPTSGWEQEPPRTQTGMLLLTPEYAAPEQVRGEAITTATDVYALGIVLYELLTGQRPYSLDGKTPSEIEEIVCERVPTRPSTVVTRSTEEPLPAAALRKTLRGDLDTLVLKALRKEPGARYGSVAELADDLRRYRRGLPVTARPATLRYRAKKFVGRHRWGVATTVTLVVLLVGFVVALVLQQQATAQERDRAQREAQKAEQIASTLLDLFASADPRHARGERLTVADLLDQGVARAQELGDEPMVQADVLYNIGLAYHGMGRYDDARRQMEQALAIRRQVDSDDSDVAASLIQLGWIDLERRDYQQARIRFDESLALLRRVAPESPNVADGLHGLGLAYNGLGDHARAETLLHDALAIRRPLLGDAHPHLANTLNDLGLVLHAQDDDTRAEALLREALAMRREVLGPNHADVARSLTLIGWFRHRAADYAAAEQNYLRSLHILQSIFDEDHPLLEELRLHLAQLYMDWGRPDDAEQYQTGDTSAANSPYAKQSLRR